MTLRSTSNTSHVPDDPWRLFLAGDVHHFEFAGTKGFAVDSKGRSAAFDCSVTQAMIDADRELSFRDALTDPRVLFVAKHEFAVEIGPRRGVVSGWTE